jgi:hypothetical protein
LRPEFEDLKRISDETGETLRVLRQEADGEIRRHFRSEGTGPDDSRRREATGDE